MYNNYSVFSNPLLYELSKHLATNDLINLSKTCTAFKSINYNYCNNIRSSITDPKQCQYLLEYVL